LCGLRFARLGTKTDQQPASSQLWPLFQACSQMSMELSSQAVALHGPLAHLAADHNSAAASFRCHVAEFRSEQGGIALNHPENHQTAVVAAS
jgi:hypothetical protein